MRSVLTSFLALLSLTTYLAADETSGTSPSPSPSRSPEASQPAAQKPATWFSVHVNGPYIAMTFDDGPSPETTPRLLDILKQRNIKATFFMIGQNAQRNPEIVKRILAEGHEIGNHSWTHPQLSKLSDQRVTDEITKTQDAIKDASGYTPVLLRPPYGAITSRQKDWIEKQFGLSIIMWSVDPFDWKRPGASVIEQRILAGARPGSIILSHDIHKQTVDAMPATLDALAQKGFKFVTVSQLIAMNQPKTSPSPGPESNPSASPRQSPNKKRPRVATAK
ncbi:MAG: polysaccharide deacetylase family protein [Verrucomicrobia bacterium]|nr:polysaccharide deacetylase family protein [Verrucomicrobiota bacterium]